MHGTQNRATKSDYLLLTLLVGLNVLNFVDRSLIASLSNYIVPDLGLSNTQFGLLTGFVFVAFYTVMGLFMGFVADRVNRIRLIAAAVALWSLLTAVSGAARGFTSLAIPRMLIGIGESALTPAALSMLADRFHPSKLGFVSSVYYLGSPIGLGLSFVIAGELASSIGWRNCFYLLGAIGLLSVPLLFFFRDDHRKPADGVRDNSIAIDFTLKNAVKDVITVVRESRPIKYTILGAMFLAVNSNAIVFDQLWLVQERGFERAQIARITGWVAISFGVLGTLYGAYAMDFCYTKFGMARAKFIFVTWLVLLPLLIMYRLASPDSPLFWLGFAGTFLLMAATTGPIFAAIQAHTPARVRATVIAFYMLCAAFFGVGICNLLIGISIDWLIAAEVSQPYTRVLLSATIISSLGLIALYLAEDKKQGPA